MIRDGVRRLFTLSFRRHDWERDVEDEIRLHLSLRAESLAQQGLTPDLATAEAIRRFGPLTESRAQLMEAARHREQRMQRVELWSTVKQDLTFAFRSFARYKLWTVVAILTLGLGIGATTAVFSATSSLLLHPLPYPNADRVVIVEQQPSEKNNTGVNVTITPSRALVQDWMAAAHSFEDLEPYQARYDMVVATHDGPSPVRAAAVLPSLFPFAGVHPLIGRAFTPAEVASHAPVILLAEGFWRDRFAADRNVVGKAITLNDTIFTIIGVAPSTLAIPKNVARPIAVWMPLDMTAPNGGASVMGRLRKGVSTGAALRELDDIAARSTHVNKSMGAAFRTVIVDPSTLVGFRQSLIILTWAVVLVLLVACTNVAHLLLARTAARRRELAIRGALGAGAGRLFRQLITESLVLTLAGALLGVLLAWIGVTAIARMHPAALSELALVRVDKTTLALTAAVAVITAITFGALGAMHTRGTHAALKAGALSTSHSRGQDRVRSVLVVSEMALSAVLLVGAALLVRGVIKLQNADLGFDPHGLYSITLGVREPNQDSSNAAALLAQRRTLAAELSARLRAAAHVKGVTLAAVPPGSRSFQLGALQVEGEAPPPTNTTALIDNNAVQPNFFDVMGIHVVQGTAFTDTSTTSSQVMINAGFARSHWGGSSPIGKHIRILNPGQSAAAAGPSAGWLTIVGVAENVNTGGGTMESTAPMLYYPETFSDNLPIVMVRTDGAPNAVGPLQKLVRALDPSRLYPRVSGIEALLSGYSAEPRFVTLLLTVFTGLAVVLAAVGMYGVMAYGVAQRTREIGIRIALGAQAAQIGRSVVTRGAVLAIIGAVIGLGIASFGGKLLANQLFGVSAHDPLSFTVGFGLLVVTAVVACLAPTRRAVRVDPVTAMRTE